MINVDQQAKDLRIHRRSGPRIANAIIAVIALLIVGIAVKVFIGAGQIRWDIVWEYFWSPAVFSGVGITLMLTLISLVGSIILGTVLAAMMISGNPVLKLIASSYIWFFRGTPLLVQIVFWFNLGLFLPTIDLFGASVNTNTIITPLTAALLGLLLNVSAFMCEVIRGGLISVDQGQTEAALSIGLTPNKALLRIVLPQAIRVILPTAGNLAIDLLKTTSLVYVIGTREIMGTTQSIAAQTFYVIETLVVASLWYLVLVTISSFLQSRLENYLARSDIRTTSKIRKVI
ncbi:amino acid ABC transporter permease [Aliirhizobium smilacinae]|uniref:Glutamate/aspartate import permease protein GltK n=1 Tax=Aliirhizobium smilacinae TaxID=1395944 RepID=A0A5C4XJI4_9HYPH|nr:amino acid ABC transporter permease [Rhizobium smilacinae]